MIRYLNFPTGIAYDGHSINCLPSVQYLWQVPLSQSRIPCQRIIVLRKYVFSAHEQVYQELDHPLYINFKNNATETLSEIRVEEIRTDNTFHMEEYYQVSAHGYARYCKREKQNLSLEDFLSLKEISSYEREHPLKHIETLGVFEDLFYTDYYRMREANELSIEKCIETYLTEGEYEHKGYHPGKDFLSGLLDITIIKPIIECCSGRDMITGERLTELEKELKIIGAAIDLFTLGQGAVAVYGAGLIGKAAVKAIGKSIALELISNTAAYSIGYGSDAIGMPREVTWILAATTGCAVSYVGGKYLLKDSLGEIKEVTTENLDEILTKVEKNVSNGLEGGLNAGLTNAQIDEIVNTPKGSRPNPSTYLSQDYIDTHLAQFDDGVSVIQTEWAYSRYSEMNGFVGVPDDNTLFVLPKDYCDGVISRANGNISVIEKELGFPQGYFSDGGGLVRIDVEDISGLNIRIPSGNETGANSLWIPGGRTSGNVPEAITDVIPLDRTKISKITVD